ncbi:hypothetical protein BDDG_09803 [Blastomyces dermatitidis ATCC 18188]|uniref:Uncharacterized protein n=1 Tax=Ajellomyces dermatitidis (strain ATCC 18188 / CBS 674.68) TaxID=653446 RepID=F2TUE0_AJEDA|nr:hypothetical protein BDDG_09803 [Blastomyces dermatitidis ATCC 18188]
MKKLQNSADSTQQQSEQSSDVLIKLFSDFSLNDYTESYIIILTEKRSGITTAVREAGNEPDIDKSAGRRDDISLQDTATIITAVREVEEDVTMRVMLLQLIDTAVFIFNLAFLTVTEAAAAL